MNHTPGVHKSHPEPSPGARSEHFAAAARDLRIKTKLLAHLILLTGKCQSMPRHHRTQGNTCTSSAGREGTSQHISPESFLLYPWLTHRKSRRKIPPQHSLEHVCTRRGKGFSTEGSKGIRMKRGGRRRAKWSRKEKWDTGCFHQQVTGSRGQHCNQPQDSHLQRGHHCILFRCSDPSASP